MLLLFSHALFWCSEMVQPCFFCQILKCCFYNHSLPLHKKWSLPLRISPGNVTKSAGKLTLKTPERCQRHSSDAFIANIEQISNFTNCSSLSIVDFVQVNAGWNISDSIFLIKPILDDVLSILEVDNYNL